MCFKCPVQLFFSLRFLIYLGLGIIIIFNCIVIFQGIPQTGSSYGNSNLVIKQKKDVDTAQLYNALFKLSYAYRSSNYVVRFREFQDTFGGFGNLMLGAIGIVTLAIPSARIPEINHCMLSEMYFHPDKRLQFSSNTDRGDGMKLLGSSHQNINTLKSEKLNAPYAVYGDTDVNIYTTAADTIAHHAFYQQYLPDVPLSDPRLYDIISSTIAQWTLSNPSPALRKSYSSFKSNVLAGCPSGQLDLAVQLRTWQDVPERRDYFESHQSCTYQCILSRIKKVKKVHAGMQYLKNAVDPAGRIQVPRGGQRIVKNSICVFITTDNATATMKVINDLQKLVSRHVDSTEKNSNNTVYLEGRRGKVVFVHSLNHISSDAQWHSVTAIRKSRQKFDPSELSKHTELLDWVLIGDARQAVYSRGRLASSLFLNLGNL